MSNREVMAALKKVENQVDGLEAELREAWYSDGQ